MSFSNDTNSKRVERITETIELLETSAASNKATQDEVWEVMGPALEAMSRLCGAQAERPHAPAEDEPEASPGPAPSSDHKTHEPRWWTLRKLAEEAPLPELTIILSVYLNRLDQHFHP